MSKPMEQYINDEIMGEEDEYSESMERRQHEQRSQKLGDLALQVVAALVACQNFKIEIPEFPMSYAAFVVICLSGRTDEMIKAMEKFLELAKPKILEHEAKTYGET